MLAAILPDFEKRRLEKHPEFAVEEAELNLKGGCQHWDYSVSFAVVFAASAIVIGSVMV